MAAIETRQTYQELLQQHNIPVRYVGEELTHATLKKFLINFMATPPKGVLTDKTDAGREIIQNQNKLKERAIMAWKKLYGKAPLLDGRRIAPPLFLGPPGFGKTETFKDVALIGSNAMEMELILDPGVEQYISRDSFVLSFIDSSGSNSSLDAGGIPFKDILKTIDFNNKEALTHVMNMMLKPSLAAIGKAGAGILIPDDIGNYAEAVQQAFLSVALEQKLGEKRFTNMAVGFASNLGKADKTSAKELSKALVGRCSVSGVLNRPEDVYNYLKTRLPVDSVDATIMISALKRNEINYNVKDSKGNHPAYIHLVPEAGDKGGFVAPRNISAAWSEARHTVYAHENLLDAMHETRAIMENHLGLNYGRKIADSMDIFARGAAPIADKLINLDQWDEATFKKSMQITTVDGKDSNMKLTPETRCFLEDLAIALVDYAANRSLTVDPKDKAGKNYSPYNKDTLVRLFKGLSQLNRVPGFPTEEYANLAITEYFTTLPRKLGEDSEFVKEKDAGQTTPGMLNSDTRLKIVETVRDYCNADGDYVTPEMFLSLKSIAVGDTSKQNMKATKAP